MRSNASGLLETPASDIRTPSKSLRSLFRVQLEMRFGSNPIEGSNLVCATNPAAILRLWAFYLALHALRGFVKFALPNVVGDNLTEHCITDR